MEIYPENTQQQEDGALSPKSAALLRRYESELATVPSISPATRRTYVSAVRVFLDWVDKSGGWIKGDPMTEPLARDWAARDYRGHMLTVEKSKPATVNKALASLSDFFTRLGPGKIDGQQVKRQDIPARAPKALDRSATIRYLRAVAASPRPRDRAIALLPLHAGLRVSEVAGLDLDDLKLTARTGTIRVLGKGSKLREVPANHQLLAALHEWIEIRGREPGPLFASRTGERMSAEAVNDVIARITKRAGMTEHITAHVLRHTFGTQLIRQSEDIVKVAELMGHSRLETTRLYTRPTADDMAAAVEKLVFDE
jgi:site-specific recombinase XerC